MDSSLQPYQILKLSELTYSFKTLSNVEYICSFQSYADYFFEYPEIADKIFNFNLYPINTRQTKFSTDKRIGDTVIKIIGDFLMNEINAVVYVCDVSDNKAAARARKFLTWFNYCQYPSFKIAHLSNCIYVGDEIMYTSLIVHKKNKYIELMVRAFFAITNDGK